jgi:hypothetical protein
VRSFAEIGPVSVAVDAANTRGTSVPHSSSAAGVYPATPTQLVASTDRDACGLIVHTAPNGSTNTAMQLKLFAGAAAAEQEFCHVIATLGGVWTTSIYCPIRVPQGTRISAKSTSSSGFQDLYASITLLRGRSDGPAASRGTPAGVLSDGNLTDVDAGATANTKGAWTQLEASTARDAIGFTLFMLQDATSAGDARFLVDLAVGAASSEQIILADTPAFFAGFSPGMITLGPIWTPIPAATRIAARVACNVNTATNRVPRVGMILWEP